MNPAAFATLIINIIILAIQEGIKYGPTVVEDIKLFIDNLGETDWTHDELEALRITGDPADFFKTAPAPEAPAGSPAL